MTCNSAALIASTILDNFYLEHLTGLRSEVYANLRAAKEEARFECEEVLPALKNEIHRIGDAIQARQAEGFGAGDEIYDSLILAVQEKNRARAHNRLRIKILAHEQSVNKAMLAELNRAISDIETISQFEDEYNVQ